MFDNGSFLRRRRRFKKKELTPNCTTKLTDALKSLDKFSSATTATAPANQRQEPNENCHNFAAPPQRGPSCGGQSAQTHQNQIQPSAGGRPSIVVAQAADGGERPAQTQAHQMQRQHCNFQTAAGQDQSRNGAALFFEPTAAGSCASLAMAAAAAVAAAASRTETTAPLTVAPHSQLLAAEQQQQFAHAPTSQATFYL